jgi:hypothetical protein
MAQKTPMMAALRVKNLIILVVLQVAELALWPVSNAVSVFSIIFIPPGSKHSTSGSSFDDINAPQANSPNLIPQDSQHGSDFWSGLVIGILTIRHCLVVDHFLLEEHETFAR